MGQVNQYQQASQLWRFILLYRRISGEQLSFMVLKRDQLRLRQHLIAARQLAHPELDQVITELLASLDSSLIAPAPTIAPSKPVLVELPARHAASWSATYRRLLEANLDNAYLSLGQRQMLDAFVSRVGLSAVQAEQVEQEVRTALDCPPMDWHLELMANLPHTGILAKPMLERLQQVYLLPGRLTQLEFNAVLKQHVSPSLFQGQKYGWRPSWRTSLIAATLVLVSVLIWNLSHGLGGADASLADTIQFQPTQAEPAELVIAGSNTLGSHLMPVLAQAYLTQKYQQPALTNVASTENETWIFNPERRVYIEVQAHGSSTGFQALAEGKTDIAASSRPIKASEAQSLSALGDMTSKACEHIVALDGVALIVHPSNSVTQLDKTQVKALFSGGITNWSQVGSLAGKVKLYARDEKSGTFETFKHLVLDKKALSTQARRFESNERLAEAVMQDPHAIGFVSLASVGQAKVLAISEGTQAFYPTRFTLASEDYPLTRRLYLYTPASPSASVQHFLDWLSSEAAQNKVAEAGFVDLWPRLQSVQIPEDAPANYRTLVNKAERLSMTFRFKPGTDLLDSRAESDLFRLVRWLERPELSGRQLVLLGFTDASGDENRNLRLSQARAESLAQALIARGIQPAKVVGFGSAVPLTLEQDQQAMTRNRRVELWLR